MSNDQFDPLMWENAHGLLSHGLIKQVNRLAGVRHLDCEERRGLLELSTALAALPTIDPDWSYAVEIECSWDDLTWVGCLDISEGEFSLRSTMFQREGIEQEMCAQWQHTAIKPIDKNNGSVQMTHDPAHIWLWNRCFRRFVDRFLNWGDEQANGDMGFGSAFSNFALHAPKASSTQEAI